MNHATVLAAATHTSTSSRAEGAVIVILFLAALALLLRTRGRRAGHPAQPRPGITHPPRSYWHCRRCRDVGSLKCGACGGKGADVGCGCMTGYVPCRACEKPENPALTFRGQTR